MVTENYFNVSAYERTWIDVGVPIGTLDASVAAHRTL